MSALPRGICSVCGMPVPVRRNGAAREHNYQGGPAIGLCKGSGRPVKAKETAGTAPKRRPRRPVIVTFEGFDYRVYADGSVTGQVLAGGDVFGEVIDAAVVDQARALARRQAARRRILRARRDLHPGPDPFRRTTQQIEYSKQPLRRR